MTHSECERKGQWPSTPNEIRMFILVMEEMKTEKEIFVTDQLAKHLQPYIKDRNFVLKDMNGNIIDYHAKKQQKHRKKQCEYCKILKSTNDSIELRLCSKCKHTRYCSRKCQKKSWNTQHRYLCKYC
eukprot:287063_1